MSTQYKHLQNKLHPEKKAKKNMKPKAPRDLMLIILICLTIIIMILAWHNLDTLGISMYASLVVSMLLVYTNRHGDFSEKEHKYLKWLSMSFVALCLILFGTVTYLQFFAH